MQKKGIADAMAPKAKERTAGANKRKEGASPARRSTGVRNARGRASNQRNRYTASKGSVYQATVSAPSERDYTGSVTRTDRIIVALIMLFAIVGFTYSIIKLWSLVR